MKFLDEKHYLHVFLYPYIPHCETFFVPTKFQCILEDLQNYSHVPDAIQSYPHILEAQMKLLSI